MYLKQLGIQYNTCMYNDVMIMVKMMRFINSTLNDYHLIFRVHSTAQGYTRKNGMKSKMKGESANSCHNVSCFVA